MLKGLVSSPGIRGGLVAMIVGPLVAAMPWIIFSIVLALEGGDFGCAGSGISCGLVWGAIFFSVATVPIGAAIAISGLITVVVACVRKILK
jgi:hypothetical protein